MSFCVKSKTVFASIHFFKNYVFFNRDEKYALAEFLSTFSMSVICYLVEIRLQPEPYLFLVGKKKKE